MIKAVLDTNVVISGIFFSGTPAKILECIAENKFHVILTEDIITEYEEVILRHARRNRFSTDAPFQIMNTIIAASTIIEAKQIISPPCDDPDDVMFLQAAIAANAKYLVSGDKHLLKVNKYPGGIVIKAGDFLPLVTK